MTLYFKAPKWHAPLPGNPRQPRCGQPSAAGGPTHRVATHLQVTCRKCMKLLASEQAKAP